MPFYVVLYFLELFLDPIMIRDEIKSLLLAGRDTVSDWDIPQTQLAKYIYFKTASLISFVVYMLAEHPAVMKRLRAEILSHVGSTRRPSYEDLRDMKFLRAVLNGDKCISLDRSIF